MDFRASACAGGGSSDAFHTPMAKRIIFLDAAIGTVEEGFSKPQDDIGHLFGIPWVDHNLGVFQRQTVGLVVAKCADPKAEKLVAPCVSWHVVAVSALSWQSSSPPVPFSLLALAAMATALPRLP